MRSLTAIMMLGAVQVTVLAQSPEPSATPETPAAVADLPNLQQQIFRDYERFEKTLYDVAEQARRKDPERAELLYRARSQSQEQRILREMETISELLRPAEAGKGAQYGSAADRQKELLARLETVLKLLQSLDERERIAAEIERIQALLKDTERVIAKQKDVRADTERGRESNRLKEAQQKVADDAEKLANKIDDQDRQRREENEEPRRADDSGSKNESGDQQNQEKQEGPENKSDDSGEKSGKSGEKTDESKKPSEGDAEQKAEGSEKPPMSDPSGEPSESSEADADSKPSDQQQPGQKSDQSGQPPDGSQDSQDQPSPSSQETPGREELEQARQKMQQAIEKLEQEQREGAVDDQDEAVARLEELKAQLEEILRQLREEEKESYLTLLEARFQNMLKRQQRINSETVRLDRIPEADRIQQSYASQTDTIRKEQNDNAMEAEKALNLLRQEGSSVAFPEAVEQMWKNMHVVVNRLSNQDTGKTTQVVEQLIQETLEEMIEAFQKELQKQQDEKQEGQPGQQGPPQDPSLVDQIAELKMIRSLQNQVNRLTEQVGTELDGKIATDPVQLQLIEDLAQRQKRIQEATYDLSVGRNR